MCAAILSDFTRDSEAFGMAAIHTDKRGNPTPISCSSMASSPSTPRRLAAPTPSA